MSKKNFVQIAKQNFLPYLKTILLKNYGIKIIALIITLVLWILAHSERF